MLKNLLVISILKLTLSANSCAEYYNPEKFYDAPVFLQEIIENNLKGIELFSQNMEKIRSLKFKKLDNLYVNKYTKYVEQVYPKKSGLFTYKLKNKKIDELSIAFVNLYKYSALEIADEINDDFEGFWNDWLDDSYEMKLLPQQILFKYKDKYFSFSVFIYGVKGDATPLSGTIIKYWFKDYTKEVNKYMSCSKK